MNLFNLKNLRKNVIHLWFIEYKELIENISIYKNCLDQQELKKAMKFIYQEDCYNYIKAHYCLRALLSYYTKIPASRLLFVYNNYGKPNIGNDNFNTLKFNMSHSDTSVLVAINLNKEIGCDIENIKENFDSSLGSSILSQEEINFIKDITDIKTQEVLFLKIWTAKEAIVKAEGTGFYTDLSSINIKFNIPGIRYKVSNSSNREWFVSTRDYNNSYVYSLATERLNPHIMLLNWSSYFVRDRQFLEKGHLVVHKL